MNLKATDKLQINLGETAVSSQVQISAFYTDFTDVSCTEGSKVSISDNANLVDIIESPGPGASRKPDFICIYNADTSNHTVNLLVLIGGATRILTSVILGSKERMEYTEKNGIQCFAVNGGVKMAQVSGSNNPALNTLNLVTLSLDVVNNNAVANTIQNVTGLSFDVVAGQTYYFEFTINYTAAATATGSRWSITGPSFTRLDYTSEYTLTATTKTVNNLGAYDLPAASNATSLAAGNICTIWGFITPSANGTVTARFASEVLSSAITAKAGSILRWVRVL